MKQLNKSDMIKILKLIADNYDKFNEKLKNEERGKIVIDTWYSCFKDLPYEVVVNAVKKTLLTCKYAPTIAEVRENCTNLTIKQRDITDLWIQAYDMLKNGLYMSKEQFESYPVECQKFFGNTNLLERMSADENINLDVVRSNFYKRVEIIQKREHENKLLPQNLQLGAMIDKLSEKYMLGG